MNVLIFPTPRNVWVYSSVCLKEAALAGLIKMWLCEYVLLSNMEINLNWYKIPKIPLEDKVLKIQTVLRVEHTSCLTLTLQILLCTETKNSYIWARESQSFTLDERKFGIEPHVC